MQMKIKEQEQAKKLRSEQGLSLKEISKRLNVAKSSVSLWVRDIKLSKKQKHKLLNKSTIFNKGAAANRYRCKVQRYKYQKQGVLLAKNCSNLFITGCMLYWAEGAKNKNSMIFCNSDKDMICLFKRFLDKEFNIEQSRYRIHVSVYVNNGITVNEIENYWLDILELNRDNLRKTVIRHKHPMSKGLKKGKLPYGVCYMRINNSTEVVQQIFGAIKEIVGITDTEKWLD